MLSWFFVVFVCLCAYTTITCRSLPVCAPMIIAAPDLAFYECLCERLLHPPSTMTAITGTPSWNDPLSMAFLFSSPAASFMLYSSDSRHDRPRAFSVATKDFLVITGTPSMTSSQRVARDFTGRHLPPDGYLVALPPLTSPRPVTLDEVGNATSMRQPLQVALRTDAKPSR